MPNPVYPNSNNYALTVGTAPERPYIPPGRNPDGTVQLAPPTMSAFSPAASQSAPPPQAAAPGAPATPEAAGAIKALIAALAQAFAPRSIVQAKQRTEKAINEASGGSDLGSQF